MHSIENCCMNRQYVFFAFTQNIKLRIIIFIAGNNIQMFYIVSNDTPVYNKVSTQ